MYDEFLKPKKLKFSIFIASEYTSFSFIYLFIFQLYFVFNIILSISQLYSIVVQQAHTYRVIPDCLAGPTHSHYDIID